MNDKQIIQLYFDRSEEAIQETAQKYGGYLYAIAKRILHSEEESEESVNDTSGTQYKFEIDNKNGTRGSVKVSAFQLAVKLYNYEQAEQYERATQFGKDIIINYKDGTTQKVSSMTNGIGGSRGKNYLEYETHFRKILDLDTVESIQVGPYLCELE